MSGTIELRIASGFISWDIETDEITIKYPEGTEVKELKIEGGQDIEGFIKLMKAFLGLLNTIEKSDD